MTSSPTAWLVALGATFSLAAPRSATSPPADQGPISLTPVLAGLASPVFVTNAHDGSLRLFVVEQPGAIKVLLPEHTVPTVFLDIAARVLSGGEQGLLGLAFHPQYAVNRRFFVDYTRQPDGATVIAEYRTSLANPDVADTAETVLLVIPQPFANHNGGMVEFGPDGFLYIGMGDGGSGNDPGNRGQDRSELLGKILRIDVDHPNGSVPYSSPSDNPFAGSTPGRDEIYAYGLRNPFRFSFDRTTGVLMAGDVGQNRWEEIDEIKRGGDYGWRIWEASECTGVDPALCQSAGFTFPIAEYFHDHGRCSVTGGYVYRGDRATLPPGTYVYGDYCSGEVFELLNGASTVALQTGLNISSFGEDELGELYVVGLGGTVHRFVSAPPCAVAVSSAGRSFPIGGSVAGVVGVTAAPGCAWTARSLVPWIGVPLNQRHTGNGLVFFSVASNAGNGLSRTAAIAIGDQVFTVTQPGVPCVASVSPTIKRVARSGGSATAAVTVPAGCAWTATSSADWIRITAGQSGSGNGSVAYAVEPGGSRTGTLRIAGHTVIVLQ
jgi:glucose/arabinose dehydrogenase